MLSSTTKLVTRCFRELVVSVRLLHAMKVFFNYLIVSFFGNMRGFSPFEMFDGFIL